MDSISDRPVRGIIAEDEGMIAIAIRRYLVSAGYEVAGVAPNGREAITLARETQPDFILMDMNMPVMNGMEAKQQILAERSVAIIMLTAYSNPEDIYVAQEAGACGYVVKPFTARTLLPKIEQCLAAFAEGKTIFLSNEQ